MRCTCFLCTTGMPMSTKGACSDTKAVQVISGALTLWLSRSCSHAKHRCVVQHSSRMHGALQDKHSGHTDEGLSSVVTESNKLCCQLCYVYTEGKG